MSSRTLDINAACGSLQTLPLEDLPIQPILPFKCELVDSIQLLLKKSTKWLKYNDQISQYISAHSSSVTCLKNIFNWFRGLAKKLQTSCNFEWISRPLLRTSNQQNPGEQQLQNAASTFKKFYSSRVGKVPVDTTVNCFLFYFLILMICMRPRIPGYMSIADMCS